MLSKDKAMHHHQNNEGEGEEKRNCHLYSHDIGKKYGLLVHTKNI